LFSVTRTGRQHAEQFCAVPFVCKNTDSLSHLETR